jgi:hypothetical protein
MGAQRPKPIHVFVSYAREDEALKDELLKHLAPLRRSGALSTWHDRDLTAGEPLPQIEAELERADVVVLLLSVDYLASDELHDRELMRAIGRHKDGKAKVIPILLRPITIEDDAPFAELMTLPSGRKPVTSWPSRDDAWNDVVRGIRRALGLPTAEEDDAGSSIRDEASAARVEIAKSRDRMIIIVAAIVAVTTIFVRTSGAPTPYLAAVTALAVIGAAGSAVRHALRSRKLAVAGAGALAGVAILGATSGASAAEGSATSGVGSLVSSLVNAASVGITAAAAGIGIGLGVEGAAAALNKPLVPSITAPSLVSPFDEITSFFAADAGVDGAASEDAGDAGDAGEDAGEDAGAAEEDAGSIPLDASPTEPTDPDPTGSVDLATFKKNAAFAVAVAKKEATACLRPGVTCSGGVSFTPDGFVGSALITCSGVDGRADAGITRCVLPFFKKRRIPPLNTPSASTGVNVPVSPFSK